MHASKSDEKNKYIEHKSASNKLGNTVSGRGVPAILSSPRSSLRFSRSKMPQARGPHDESYEDFYAAWSRKQEEYLHDLETTLESNMKEGEIRELVSKVEQHYEFYYQAKDRAAHQNILQIISPHWRSPLEKAFLWIGGWRPSMVFQLVYAQAGEQTEAELAELLEGVDSPTLAALSSKQLSEISDYQAKIQEAEGNVCQRMAMLQQDMADQPLVGLSKNENGSSAPLEDAVQEKLKSLEELLVEADILRLSTLKHMLEILSPLQAAQYLVAAARLQIAIRQIGKKKQDSRPTSGTNHRK